MVVGRETIVRLGGLPVVIAASAIVANTIMAGVIVTGAVMTDVIPDGRDRDVGGRGRNRSGRYRRMRKVSARRAG